MPESVLDHIVVTAPNLKAGVQWVRAALGATPEFGGEHAAMGTHNCLLKLGARAYLEVIARDPNAPDPQRPRWFGLDELRHDASPALCAWVARTTDVRTASAAAHDWAGAVETMRRGDLDWQIAIPQQGRPPFNGIAPMLIEWPAGVHPTERMRESGCTLLLLEGFHPEPGAIEAALAAIGFGGEVRVRATAAGERPHLVAHIRTANGVKRLDAA